MRAPNCATGPRWNIASTLFVTCGRGAVNQGIDPGTTWHKYWSSAERRCGCRPRWRCIEPRTSKGCCTGILARLSPAEAWHTPLAYAVARGREEIVRLLIERGAVHTLRSPGGETPSEIAQKAGHREDRTDSQGSGGRGRSPKLACLKTGQNAHVLHPVKIERPEPSASGRIVCT